MKIKLEPSKDLLRLDESERIRWATELESGKYEQGKGFLFSDGKYCCLGVWQSCNGHKDTEMDSLRLPTELTNPTSIDGEGLQYIIATKNGTTFATLNDGFERDLHRFSCSFNQIAQLLRGNEIEVMGIPCHQLGG